MGLYSAIDRIPLWKLLKRTRLPFSLHTTPHAGYPSCLRSNTIQFPICSSASCFVDSFPHCFCLLGSRKPGMILRNGLFGIKWRGDLQDPRSSQCALFYKGSRQDKWVWLKKNSDDASRSQHLYCPGAKGSEVREVGYAESWSTTAQRKELLQLIHHTLQVGIINYIFQEDIIKWIFPSRKPIMLSKLVFSYLMMSL